MSVTRCSKLSVSLNSFQSPLGSTSALSLDWTTLLASGLGDRLASESLLNRCRTIQGFERNSGALRLHSFSWIRHTRTSHRSSGAKSRSYQWLNTPHFPVPIVAGSPTTFNKSSYYSTSHLSYGKEGRKVISIVVVVVVSSLSPSPLPSLLSLSLSPTPPLQDLDRLLQTNLRTAQDGHYFLTSLKTWEERTSLQDWISRPSLSPLEMLLTSLGSDDWTTTPTLTFISPSLSLSFTRRNDDDDEERYNDLKLLSCPLGKRRTRNKTTLAPATPREQTTLQEIPYRGTITYASFSPSLPSLRPSLTASLASPNSHSLNPPPPQRITEKSQTCVVTFKKSLKPHLITSK